MMTMNEFRQEIMVKMGKLYGEEYEIFPEDLKRNNGVKRYGISLWKKDFCISPVVYLEKFYESYQSGESIAAIITGIRDVIRGAVPVAEVEQMTESLKDFNLVQRKLRCRLINYQANEEALNGQVFRRVSDLALVLEVSVDREVDGGRGGCLSMRIHKKLGREWGISEEELIDLALENGSRENPAQFFCLGTVLNRMAKGTWEESGTLAEQVQRAAENVSDGEPDSYVLTVKGGVLGAVAVMYPGCLEIIAQNLGTDLLILPSSIHETIIVPCPEGDKMNRFREMVRAVNCECVDAEDWLSDQVYVFRLESLMMEAA